MKKEKDNELENQQPIEELETAEEQKTTAVEAEEWEGKYNEVNDKYLRLYSEFDNFRKRTNKEKLDAIKFGGEDVIKSLLSVVDDFERAIESMDIDNDVHKEGISLIYNKLQSILQQKGVKPIQAKGEKFNEELHEAIGQAPAPENTEKGIVLEEVEKGYLFYEKIIRYSKVIVAI